MRMLAWLRWRGQRRAGRETAEDPGGPCEDGVMMVALSHRDSLHECEQESVGPFHSHPKAAVPERLECGVEPVATVTAREEKVAGLG